MNARKSIYKEIEQITGENEISDKLKFKDDLKFDSLDIIDLIMNLEKEYNLPEIDSRTIPEIVTVGDLVDVFEAIDPKKKNIQIPARYANMPALHVKTLCKITEKPCTRIQSAMDTKNPCAAVKCKIAMNVYKLLSDTQKIR